MWFSVPDRSSQGWLEPLKLSGARCCLLLARPFIFLLFASLSFLFSIFVFFSLVFPLGVLYGSLFMAFKANRSHDCSIPLLPPSDYMLLFAWNSLSLCHVH